MSKSKNIEDKTQYDQQERQLSSQSAAFIKMLAKRGILEDPEINDEKIRQVEKSKRRNTYHNTQMILRYYRDITWALNCFPSQIAEELDEAVGGLDELLSRIRIEIGMENKELENRLISIKRSRLLLDRVNEALTVLRQKPGNGELMYNILYLTYIAKEKLRHNDILFRLNISQRHYYRTRQQAINILSIRLWAAPAGGLDSWLEVLTLLEAL